jgi:hypothetical protein
MGPDVPWIVPERKAKSPAKCSPVGFAVDFRVKFPEKYSVCISASSLSYAKLFYMKLIG